MSFLYANPYNPDAQGFYFSGLDDCCEELGKAKDRFRMSV